METQLLKALLQSSATTAAASAPQGNRASQVCCMCLWRQERNCTTATPPAHFFSGSYGMESFRQHTNNWAESEATAELLHSSCFVLM